MTNPKYQVFRSIDDGQFYYRLKAANGEIVLNSEGYSSKKDCLERISSVRINARFDSNFMRNEVLTNYSFVLEANNGEIIGTSEGYTDFSSREDGIYAVKRDGITAPVEDLS